MRFLFAIASVALIPVVAPTHGAASLTIAVSVGRVPSMVMAARMGLGPVMAAMRGVVVPVSSKKTEKTKTGDRGRVIVIVNVVRSVVVTRVIIHGIDVAVVIVNGASAAGGHDGRALVALPVSVTFGGNHLLGTFHHRGPATATGSGFSVIIVGIVAWRLTACSKNDDTQPGKAAQRVKSERFHEVDD